MKHIVKQNYLRLTIRDYIKIIMCEIFIKPHLNHKLQKLEIVNIHSQNVISKLK